MAIHKHNGNNILKIYVKLKFQTLHYNILKRKNQSLYVKLYIHIPISLHFKLLSISKSDN